MSIGNGRIEEFDESTQSEGINVINSLSRNSEGPKTYKEKSPILTSNKIHQQSDIIEMSDNNIRQHSNAIQISDDSSDDDDQVEIKEDPIYRNSIFNKPSILNCGSTKTKILNKTIIN